MTNIEYELNEKIHAIIINPYLSWEEFCVNCDLIRKFNIKNISTSLNYLTDIKNCLGNYNAAITALISYPLADLPVSFIEEIVCFAKDKGAKGIEYIPNFINLSKRNLETFAHEIEQVKLSGLPVSIIINNTKIQEEIFINAIEICLELGIKNFQFGDGFGSPITSNDVPEILKITGSQYQIKVVGGIKKLTQVIDLFDNGISYVGTSNFFEIFQEVKVI